MPSPASCSGISTSFRRHPASSSMPAASFMAPTCRTAGRRRRHLTLNYGVRYEPFMPWHEMQGRMGSFFPTLWASDTHSTDYPIAPAGLQFAGDPGFNPNGVAPPTTTSCPGWASPGMSSATAKPACAAAPACSSTAASTAPCSISTPTLAVHYHRRVILNASRRTRSPSPIPTAATELPIPSRRRSRLRQHCADPAAELADLRPVQRLPGSAHLRLEPGRGAAIDASLLACASPMWPSTAATSGRIWN